MKHKLSKKAIAKREAAVVATYGIWCNPPLTPAQKAEGVRRAVAQSKKRAAK